MAHNSAGTTVGGDRLHDAQAAARPRAGRDAQPGPFGAPSTLAGTLSGTGNAGRPIQLQQKPFPFTTAFANVGNAQLTNAQGGFSFALLSVPLTTQYRVLVTDKTSVVSPILTVNVTVVVGTRTTRTHVTAAGTCTSPARCSPKVANIPIAIQKLNAKNHWVTISGTITRNGGLRQDRAHQARRQLPRLRGASGGTFAPGTGRKVRIPHELEPARQGGRGRPAPAPRAAPLTQPRR